MDQVLRLHGELIQRYGGARSTRDMGLLRSALAQPQVSFGGRLLHADVFEMAAAYLDHIVQNHPFVNGNKRTGAAAALVFLWLSGIEIENDEAGLVALTVGVSLARTRLPVSSGFKPGRPEGSPE